VEPEIDLDFSEFGDINNDRALLSLVELARFKIGGLLRYVKLPANGTNEPRDLKARRNGLKLFFEDMKNRGLKSIMELQVDESIDHPCPDTVIKSTLRGLKIDTLDWRKTDMCAQVIIYAAKHVRSLHLYCSGNRAILMNWSATDGLPKLPNVSHLHITIASCQANRSHDMANTVLLPTQLSMVKITILWGRVETGEDLEANFHEFCRRLRENIDTNRKITIEHEFQKVRGVTWSSSLLEENSKWKPGPDYDSDDGDDMQVYGHFSSCNILKAFPC
jgi:hypothetical protein